MWQCDQCVCVCLRVIWRYLGQNLRLFNQNRWGKKSVIPATANYSKLWKHHHFWVNILTCKIEKLQKNSSHGQTHMLLKGRKGDLRTKKAGWNLLKSWRFFFRSFFVEAQSGGDLLMCLAWAKKNRFKLMNFEAKLPGLIYEREISPEKLGEGSWKLYPGKDG